VPATKWIYKGLHDGAKVIRDEARRLAPVLDSEAARQAFASRRNNRAGYELPEWQQKRVPGNLKNNIVEHSVRSQFGSVVVRVRTKSYIFSGGSNSHKSNLVDNPNYWWLVEFGTSKMPARPFLRPAFERKKAEAIEVIRASLSRGLVRIIKQLRPPLRHAA
jgi:HK97 gp10 family phage protein